MLLATTCPACGALGPAPCPPCRARARPAPALPAPPGVDRCAALLCYEGVGREVVARLKYRNARSALPWLAAGMAALVADATPAVVTWVPTTGARRRARGFDQGRLLAGAVARRLGVPCRPLLRRLPGPPQTGATRSARLRGPRLVLRRRAAVAGRHVVVVDDVVTTGATLAAAARALRAGGAGAARVTAVAAARRPPPGRPREPPEPAGLH
ncbi:MAG: ComF family protein [Acidimicrobiia bacterium]